MRHNYCEKCFEMEKANPIQQESNDLDTRKSIKVSFLI